MSETAREKVARGAAWYVDDQRLAQLGTPGRRWAIEGRWRQFDQAIARWAADRPGRPLRVLDAGCGDGINTAAIRRMLADRGFPSDLFGTDYNELRLGRARADAELAPLAADLLKLPFRDATFDVVLCNHVLEHIPEDRVAMRELARVMTSDGLMLVGVPNEGCLLAALRNRVLQRSIMTTTDHVNFYTADILVERLASAGLSLRGPVGTEGFFVPHLGTMTRLRETGLGRYAIDTARRWLPSQAAGLIVALGKTP